MALTAIATLVLARKFLEPSPQPNSRTFEVVAGGFVPSSPVLSPDGRKIAFVRGDRLWLRHLDRLEPVPVEGTEGATHSAWSSNSESILFNVHRATETADTIAVYRDGRIKYIGQTPGQSIMQPVYSPTGQLVYRRNGPKAGLWAAPFSLASLEVTGEPFLITTNGILPSVAHDGTLLFVRNAGEGGVRSQLVWVERDGKIGDSVGPEMDGIAARAAG